MHKSKDFLIFTKTKNPTLTKTKKLALSGVTVT